MGPQKDKEPYRVGLGNLVKLLGGNSCLSLPSRRRNVIPVSSIKGNMQVEIAVVLLDGDKQHSWNPVFEPDLRTLKMLCFLNAPAHSICHLLNTNGSDSTQFKASSKSNRINPFAPENSPCWLLPGRRRQRASSEHPYPPT